MMRKKSVFVARQAKSIFELRTAREDLLFEFGFAVCSKLEFARMENSAKYDPERHEFARNFEYRQTF